MSGGTFEEEHEPHENHERYLITYADMITLLLALFIILFALGQVDLAKFQQFRAGLTKEFGAPGLEGGQGVLDGGRTPLGEQIEPVEVREAAGGLGGHVEEQEKERVAQELRTLLKKAGTRTADATVKVDTRGVVVQLATDDVTFASGSWTLEGEGLGALRALFGPLAQVDNDIIIEGHTDNRPMTPPLTNWELAANRAAAVVRFLTDELTVPEDRVSLAAYAATRPVAPNATPEGRAANRRVEIVLVVNDAPGEGIKGAEPRGLTPGEVVNEPVGDAPVTGLAHDGVGGGTTAARAGAG